MLTGCVVINLSEETALGLASALSGEKTVKFNDDSADAIGEIDNMVAGGAKKDFPGDSNSISVPSVVVGKHKIVYPTGLPIISIPSETGVGPLVVDVALKANTTSASNSAVSAVLLESLAV